jgi:hypothetical protein
LEKFGAFANIAAIAAILVALFGYLAPKMIGGLRQWTWLAGDSPSFLVAAGARFVAIAVMVLAYITISASNYLAFAVSAVVVGVLGVLAIVRFDRDRKLYVVAIPEVGQDGKPLLDSSGKPTLRNVVIGSERELRPDVARDLAEARKERGGLSVERFMSGYGSINDPKDLWDAEILAAHSTGLTTGLIYILLSGVVTLFLASLVLDAAGVVG